MFGIARGAAPDRSGSGRSRAQTGPSRGCRARSRSARSRRSSARRRVTQRAARRSARAARQGAGVGAPRRIGPGRGRVRTRKVGHFFPGGTVDAFDVWVELEAVDDQRPRAAPQRRGRATAARARSTRARISIAACSSTSTAIRSTSATRGRRDRSRTCGSFLPGAADTIHYRLRLPTDAGRPDLPARRRSTIASSRGGTRSGRLRGVRDPAQPQPAVSRSYDDGRWRVHGRHVEGVGTGQGDSRHSDDCHGAGGGVAGGRDRGAAAADGRRRSSTRSVRERWNDYGIGLLLQGDLKGAEAAFLKVTEMDPRYADGPVNVARARIQEGDVDGRRSRCSSKALHIDPRARQDALLPGHRAQDAWAATTKRSTHLRVAAEKYPRDRVVLNQIGRVQFLQRRFDDAIATFKRVLLVDPEDLQAHYNLMLCYQGIGNADARRARAGALHAIQGRRSGAGDHRPVPAEVARRQQRTPADSRARPDGAETDAGRAGRLRRIEVPVPLRAVVALGLPSASRRRRRRSPSRT